MTVQEFNMTAQELKDILSLALQFANLIIIIYGGYKFLNKPHDTLEEKHNALEKRVDEQDLVIKNIEKSLDSSHQKHREQDRTNRVFKRVFILLANFEVAFCQQTGYEHTEDLMKAKDELEEYLAGD